MYTLCARRGGWRSYAGQIAKFSSSSKLANRPTVYEQLSSITSDNSAASSVREFARRHIGPNDAQTSAMLEYIQLQVITCCAVAAADC